MQLEQLQQDLLKAIFSTDSKDAEDYVKGDKTLSAKQRVGIYRGSVHGILTTSLGVTFPVCKQLVGETFFDKMCDEFINQYPPVSPFFAHYGDQFSEFLQNFDPVKSLPYLSDVAVLEWVRNVISQQALAEPFDFSALSTLDDQQQAQLRFKLKDTMRLIRSDFRIDSIWFAHQPDNEIDLELVDIDESVYLIIWKNQHGVRIKDFMDKEQLLWEFLYAISEDQNLAQLAERFGDDLPELLNKSIQQNWIQSFSTTM